MQNSTFDEAIRDHFNVGIEAQKKWAQPQRYWWDDTFWDKQGLGPVFILIGGEGEISGKFISEGPFVRQLGAELGALLVHLEHRFYGESIPTEDMSIKSLGLLSVDQALEDVVYFLEHFQVEMGAVGRPVIAFGGSYAGCLAAWLRLRYPHIIAGSVASSAPIKSQRVYPEYMDVVASSIVHFGGPKCHEHLKDAVQTIAGMLNRAEYDELDSDFGNCKPLSSYDDSFRFTISLMTGVKEVVSFNELRSNQLNVTDMCKILEHATSPYEGFATFNKKFIQMRGDNCTKSSYEDYKECLSRDSVTKFDSRQWMFQTCTSFGYWQVAAGPFSALQDRANATAFEKLCRDIFGGDVIPENPESADSLAEIINMRFGGLDIDTSNVVFAQGGMDPWSKLGIQPDVTLANDEEVLAWMDYGSHCSDMYYFTSDNESIGLSQAHETIRGEVIHFLSDLPTSKVMFGDDGNLSGGKHTDDIIISRVAAVLLIATIAIGAIIILKWQSQPKEKDSVYRPLRIRG